MKTFKKLSEVIASLESVSMQMRGLAELLEWERPDHIDLTDNEEKAKRGKGLILAGLAEQVAEIGIFVDEYVVGKGSRHE